MCAPRVEGDNVFCPTINRHGFRGYRGRMGGQDQSIELSEVFVLLADSLRPDHDVVDTLDILIQASTTFTSAVEAGIVLVDEARVLHVVASSSERASDVEETQLGSSAGPCFDAFETGVVVEIPDIGATVERWPEFAQVTRARGLAAAHAVPLHVRGTVIGAWCAERTNEPVLLKVRNSERPRFCCH
jgi:hypothetical protein